MTSPDRSERTSPREFLGGKYKGPILDTMESLATRISQDPLLEQAFTLLGLVKKTEDLVTELQAMSLERSDLSLEAEINIRKNVHSNTVAAVEEKVRENPELDQRYSEAEQIVSRLSQMRDERSHTLIGPPQFVIEVLTWARYIA